uniref:Polyphenol oxidase n=1 Tax=Morus alba var. multicaulis TaxID=170012 RepID=A0A0N7EI22_MORAL|nr:polyphenol oxidase [Morus alba var. multicaulis]
MGSLVLTQPLAITTSLCPFPAHTKTTLNTKRRQSHIIRRSSISCNNHASSNQSSDETSSQYRPQLGKVERRNVLIGLGMTGLGSNPLALANPVNGPDTNICNQPKLLDGTPLPDKCCAPKSSSDIIDYKPPPFTKLRVRPAAHKADKEYIAKYNEALSMMKGLDDTDPRSFKQQADVHCAYCNYGYDQDGYPGVELQVHFNWLFFPFHRWYLYFYERILGKLIGDPDFAIPFWNWDHPDGMTMPAMFTSDPNSDLYDVNRSPKHQPPYGLDLEYNKDNLCKPPKPYKQLVEDNLATMYRQMVSGASQQLLFFGGEYKGGEEPVNQMGTIESTPHNNIHVWSGSEKNPNGEDMGNFYSAGRDPMFYALHGNVDRMWSIWKSLPGKNNRDITDCDWLNSTFLFYDENAQLVRVRVGDCLDTEKLGYVYEQVDLPWLNYKPRAKSSTLLRRQTRSADQSRGGLTPLTDFPIKLTKKTTVLVARPKKGKRSKAEKEKEEEVLVVEGIDFDMTKAVKFDVYINDEDESGPGKSEFAGSFTTVPHFSTNKKKMPNVKLTLGITELLEDVGAEDDDNVFVTLVPKSGNVTIGGIKIVFLS